MDWIESEAFGFACPLLAEKFVRREPFEGLQSAPEIVSRDEVVEMALQLFMGVVMIALDGRLLNGAVHSFDLSVRPGVIDFGESVLDAVFLAAHLKHVR